jgi:hypothetical protein
MIIRVVMGLALLVVAVSANSVALANEKNACAHSETRTVDFTDWNSADSVTLVFAGKDCASTSVRLTIVSEAFGEIFSHEVDFSALTAVLDSEINASDAQATADDIWAFLDPQSTRDLEPWKAPQEIYDLFDEIPALPRDAYEAARQLGRPYICVQSYYEGADCYWFNPQNQTQLLLKLSD